MNQDDIVTQYRNVISDLVGQRGRLDGTVDDVVLRRRQHYQAQTRQERWKEIFRGVPVSADPRRAKIFRTIPIGDVLLKNDSSSPTYLHPWDVSTLPDHDRDVSVEGRSISLLSVDGIVGFNSKGPSTHLSSRGKMPERQFLAEFVATTTPLFGATRFITFLKDLKDAFCIIRGEAAWQQHPDVQLLSYAFKDLCDGLPPFEEDPHGGIVLSALTPHKTKGFKTGSTDCVIAKRFEILTRLIVYDLLGHISVELETYRDSWYEALEDPFYLFKDMKSIRGIGETLGFARTQNFPSLILEGDEERGYAYAKKRVHIFGPMSNDEAWYDYYFENEWKPASDKVKGFERLKKRYEYYADADGTEENKRGYSELKGLDQVIGFVGGIFVRSVRDQNSKQAPMIPYTDPSHSPGGEHELIQVDEGHFRRVVLKDGRRCGNGLCQFCSIYDAWVEMFEANIHHFPSWEKFQRMLPSLTTSRSAGVIPQNITVIDPNGETTSTIKITSKAGQLLFFGDRITREDIVLSDWIGRFSVRWDLGRPVRYICMIPDFVYYYESAVMQALGDYQATLERYTLKKMDERHIGNMAPFLAAASSTNVHYINLAYDISAMDINTLIDTIFTPLLAAFTDVCIANADRIPQNFGPVFPQRFDVKWGDKRRENVPGFESMFSAIYGGLQNRPFTAKDFTGQIETYLDQLASGLKGTITVHNTNNPKLLQMFLTCLRSLPLEGPVVLEVVLESYTGDDASVVLKMSARPTAATFRRMYKATDMMQRIMAMPVELLKTSIRQYLVTYLKRTVLYGEMPQLAARQPIFTNERSKTDVRQLDKISAISSSLQELLTRGADDVACTVLRLCMSQSTLDLHWSETDLNKPSGAPKLKGRFFAKAAERLGFSLPFSTLFIPRAYGGFGTLPYTTLIDSKDAILFPMIEYWYGRESLEYLEGEPLQTTLRILRAKEPSDVLSMIVNPDPEKMIKQFSQRIDGPQTRLSRQSFNRLEVQSKRPDILGGAPPPVPRHMAWGLNMRDIFARNISDLNDIPERRADYKSQLYHSIYTATRNAKKPKKNFDWTRLVTFRFGEKRLTRQYPHSPIHMAEGRWRDLLLRIGVSANGARTEKPFRLLSNIRNIEFTMNVKAEEALKFIIDTGYADKSSYVREVLIAMGAEPAAARSSAQKISELRLNPLDAASMQGWSYSDPVLGFLDTGEQNMLRCVKIAYERETLGQPSLEKVVQDRLYQYGFMLVLNDPLHRPVEITVGLEFFEWAQKHIREL